MNRQIRILAVALAMAWTLMSCGGPKVCEPPPGSPPTRDPCAFFCCPEGQHCTAPADAPYCVAD